MNYSRQPPPSGPPTRFAFANRMYNGRNLRPVVIVTTSFGAIWGLFSMVNAIQSLQLTHQEGEAHLATFSIALAAVFGFIFAAELFGLVAAFSQRFPLIRIYTMLSVFVALSFVGSSLVQTVVHFSFKSEILDECNKASTGETATYRYGIFGPTSSEQLNSDDASSFCNNAWSRDSLSQIASLLILMIINVFKVLTAIAYYRQSADPTSIANASRIRTPAGNAAYPSHYNPPYNAPVPNLGYNYPTNSGGGYAPPPGPPPGAKGLEEGRDEGFRAPAYDDDEDKDWKDHHDAPGYGHGLGLNDDKKSKTGSGDNENPFEDFDGPVGERFGEERDVTSRPRPGGSESFRL